MLARAGWALVAVAVLALGASGCARAQARIASVPPPPLDVPLPPPRMVEPVLAELPPAEEIPQEQVDAGAEKPVPPPQPKPRPETARTEGAPAETPPPDPPKPAQSATLQTIPPSKEGQVQRSIRVHLDGAVANLNRVDYGQLSVDGRSNFDQARRFIAQAEEALRVKNLVFAATVADKAATLAAQLAGR